MRCRAAAARRPAARPLAVLSPRAVPCPLLRPQACSSVLSATATASAAFELHAADSMAQVRRGGAPEQCREVGPDDTLTIEMVQNEHEAAQLVVTVPSSYAKDFVYNLTWAVGPLVNNITGAVIPASDVVTPLGFVAGDPALRYKLTHFRPRQTMPAGTSLPLRAGRRRQQYGTLRRIKYVRQCVDAPVGAMLQAQGSTPYDDPRVVANCCSTMSTPLTWCGTAQPLLVTVRSRASTAPGMYTAHVTVTSNGQHEPPPPKVIGRVCACTSWPADEVRALSLGRASSGVGTCPPTHRATTPPTPTCSTTYPRAHLNLPEFGPPTSTNPRLASVASGGPGAPSLRGCGCGGSACSL